MVFTLAPRISIDLVKHRIQARNIPKNRADDPLLSDRERPPQNVNDSSTYLSTTKIPQTSSLGDGALRLGARLVHSGRPASLEPVRAK